MTATSRSARSGGEIPRRGRMYRSLHNSGFSYKEIADEFGDSPRKAQALVDRVSKDTARYSRNEVAELVIAFCQKFGRWPASGEWKNENGLPSRSTLHGIYYGYGWSRRRFDGDVHEMTRVQQEIARHPKLTAKVALLLPNATCRRDACARFGAEQLVKHMTLIDNDPKVGKLYRSTDATMLQVVNSTPEPDGTHAVYVLSTPPGIRKARQALAWTFGVTEGWRQFKIQKQS